MTVDELLLGDAEKELERTLESLFGKGDLEEAFGAWLLGGLKLPFQLGDSANKVAKHIGGERTYKDIAILGFASASGLLAVEGQNALESGLAWVLGRAPLMNGQLQGFCTDVVALLGITLGVQSLASDDMFDALYCWLDQFVEKSFQTRLFGWQQCLLEAVCQISKIGSYRALPDTQALADVRIALWSKSCLQYDSSLRLKDQLQTLLLMKRERSSEINQCRAALRLAAFSAVQSLSPVSGMEQSSIGDVIKILNRIPSGFRRWTWENKGKTRNSEARKWNIDNEYHVQNLLYFLLVPYFPDLTEEEYTPSIGPMHPRADLGIPSLELIIEVKFMRRKDTPQKMIEQIAADASLYLVEGSRYRQIIAFIWDDSRRSEEYDCMKEGLSQLSGIVGVVIISRPGNLNLLETIE